MGGGLKLAAAARVRTGEPSAFFVLPEGQRGIFTGGGATVRIARIITAPRMVDMVLAARTFDAQKGLDLGLAHELVEDDKSLERAMELAKQVAKYPPTTNFAITSGIARINYIVEHRWPIRRRPFAAYGTNQSGSARKAGRVSGQADQAIWNPMRDKTSESQGALVNYLHQHSNPAHHLVNRRFLQDWGRDRTLISHVARTSRPFPKHLGNAVFRICQSLRQVAHAQCRRVRPRRRCVLHLCSSILN